MAASAYHRLLMQDTRQTDTDNCHQQVSGLNMMRIHICYLQNVDITTTSRNQDEDNRSFCP